MNDRLVVELPSGNETVLVAQSDPSDREAVAWLLDLQGYEVLRASDGIEALALSEERGVEEIHLLLTGVQLPRMGGKDLVSRVRIARPKIKVVFTDDGPDGAAVCLGECGRAPAALPKPFTLEDLAVKVRQVLDG